MCAINAKKVIDLDSRVQLKMLIIAIHRQHAHGIIVYHATHMVFALNVALATISTTGNVLIAKVLTLVVLNVQKQVFALNASLDIDLVYREQLNQ